MFKSTTATISKALFRKSYIINCLLKFVWFLFLLFYELCIMMSSDVMPACATVVGSNKGLIDNLIDRLIDWLIDWLIVKLSPILENEEVHYMYVRRDRFCRRKTID